MGYMNISSTAGASGRSYTSWENYLNLLEGWEAGGAKVTHTSLLQGRPTSATALWPNGIQRWADYAPTPAEEEAARTSLLLAKVERLSELGLQVEAYDRDTAYLVDRDYYGYQVDFADFDLGDTAAQVMRWARLYSPCCGGELDSDYMLCPDCGEHC